METLAESIATARYTRIPRRALFAARPGADDEEKRAQARMLADAGRRAEEHGCQPAEAKAKQGAEEKIVTHERLSDFSLFRDIDEIWCPELVVIPPSEFMMGSTEAEREWAVGQGANREWVQVEKPQHRVRIDATLAVGRHPVTFEEYDHFADATGREKPSDEGWGRGRRPVINVSWEDARAYVSWLSKETGQAYRLLSEAEWEYAARAGTTTRHWWGDDITSENASFNQNVGKTSIRYHKSMIRAVRLFGWTLALRHWNGVAVVL
jgi:hypothetical protein